MMNNVPRVFVGTTTFHVGGMSCDRCRLAVIREIGEVDRVDRVTIDPATGTVTVAAAAAVDRADLAAAVARAGYTLRP